MKKNFSTHIFKFFLKDRNQFIEALEFSYFLEEISTYLEKKYSNKNNKLIKFFLQLVNYWRSWQYNLIEDYKQLLVDSIFWKSREYYLTRIKKFLSYELDTLDFIAELLYPILSNKNEAKDFQDDFIGQAKIELDSKSFGFSKILWGLPAVLEGFDEDPEESVFTEKEFREIIENVLTELEKYPIEKNIDNDTAVLQSIMLFFIGILGISYLFLKPEVFDFFSNYSEFFH